MAKHQRFLPVSRPELIRRLRTLGFVGPQPGTRHAVMVRGGVVVRIPNPHRRKDIGVGLLRIILREGEVSRDEWEGCK